MPKIEEKEVVTAEPEGGDQPTDTPEPENGQEPKASKEDGKEKPDWRALHFKEKEKRTQVEAEAEALKKALDNNTEALNALKATKPEVSNTETEAEKPAEDTGDWYSEFVKSYQETPAENPPAPTGLSAEQVKAMMDAKGKEIQESMRKENAASQGMDEVSPYLRALFPGDDNAMQKARADIMDVSLQSGLTPQEAFMAKYGGKVLAAVEVTAAEHATKAEQERLKADLVTRGADVVGLGLEEAPPNEHAENQAKNVAKIQKAMGGTDGTL